MMSSGTSRKHIINVSSLQGCLALPERSAYSASKHALQAFSDSLRAEMRSSSQNVHVMVVNPGYVRTNLSLNARTGDGSLHNKMDENTAKGMHHVIFIYLRRLLPAF